MVKNSKKFLALAMCVPMVLGTSLTAFAADPTPDPAATEAPAPGDPEAVADAPIWSYNIQSIIVPTDLKAAFNPDGLDVLLRGDDSDTVNTQVVSLNYGIANTSTKDKIVTVKFTVDTKNKDAEGKSKIELVDSAAKATNVGDKYAMYLTVVPAAGEVKSTGASPALFDKEVTAAALGDVSMTGATAAAVSLVEGDTTVSFKLEKAKYEPASGDEGKVVLGETTDISSSYTLSDLAAAGKGVTAFAFSGALNEGAAWEKITQAVNIKATYTISDVTGDEIPVAGTGAMVRSTTIDLSGAGASMVLGIADKGTPSFKLLSYTTNAGQVTAFNKPAVANTHYTYDADSDTFAIASTFSTNNKAGTYEISFSDDEDFKLTVNWTK